jgi:glycyl-tRNA synthetase alpha chain
VFDLVWVQGSDGQAYTYGDVFKRNEYEYSRSNFEIVDIDMLYGLFDTYEAECRRTLEAGIVLPAYDYVLKCSHAFNLLDARGAIAVAERVSFIGRVRALAKACCAAYVSSLEPADAPSGESDAAEPEGGVR